MSRLALAIGVSAGAMALAAGGGGPAAGALGAGPLDHVGRATDGAGRRRAPAQRAGPGGRRGPDDRPPGRHRPGHGPGGELAASQLNADGGVLGRPIRIVPVDDRATPSVGVTAARRAVAGKIAAVVGPFNSAVGLKALPVYQAAGVSILRLTSATTTQGYGVTTQPMSTQVAPVEVTEISRVLHARRVAVLFDPSAYTAGIAAQLATGLKSYGVAVPVEQSLAPVAKGPGAGRATARSLARALAAVAAARPSLTYLAMYGPEAGQVAQAMAGAHGRARYGTCFTDLAAQGPGFVTAAGVAAASRCWSSGVPAAQLPGGSAYTAAYRAAYGATPGTWGAFAYDSVGLWVVAATWAHQLYGPSVREDLAHTSGYRGATGQITFLPGTGNRKDPPVVIMYITAKGQYRISRQWARAVGYTF